MAEEPCERQAELNTDALRGAAVGARRSRDAFSLAAAFLAFGALLLVNVLSDRAFLRWDLTSEQRYSLGRPFHRLLDKLESPARVTYYVSGQAPQAFEAAKLAILDQLNEVRIAARGRIELEVVDPAANEALREQLRAEGMEWQVDVSERDRMVSVALYSGLHVTYLDRPTRVIPLVLRAEDLEYVLANALHDLTLLKRPVVTIHFPRLGRTTRQSSSGFEWLFKKDEALAKKFDLRFAALTEDSPLPKETQLLILMRPYKLGPRARYEVLRYLAEGGRILLASSPWKLTESGRQEETPTGLEEYLAGLGLTWGPGFLSDELNFRMAAPGEMPASYPFYIQIAPENLNQESPITRFLPPVLMPWAGELATDDARIKEQGLTLEVLARTSPKSWSTPLRPNLPERIEAPSRPVFLQMSGVFPFPFAGRPEPEWDPQPGAEQRPGYVPPPPAPPVQSRPGVLLVWSCPESFHEQYVQRFAPDPRTPSPFEVNKLVLPNVAEVCSLGPDLITLRAKNYETRALAQLDDARRNGYKAFMVFFPPLLVVLGAAVFFWRRRSTQHRYERGFARTSGPSSFTP